MSTHYNIYVVGWYGTNNKISLFLQKYPGLVGYTCIIIQFKRFTNIGLGWVILDLQLVCKITTRAHLYYTQAGIFIFEIFDYYHQSIGFKMDMKKLGDYIHAC